MHAFVRMSLGPALLLASCDADPAPGWWAVDRGAGALVQLDAALVEEGRLELPGVELALASDRRLWLAAPGPPGELLVLEGGAARTLRRWPGAILALAPAPGQDVFVLLGPPPPEGRTQVWRVSRCGRETLLAAYPDARALAAERGSLVVGCAGGQLVELDAGGALRHWTHVPGGVQALVPGPEPGSWWVLTGGAQPRIERRGAGLALAGGFLAGSGELSLAAAGREARVWLVQGGALRRHGPDGALELALDLPAGPWSVAWATAERVLLRAPGAVLEVRARGGSVRIVQTQGGFAALSALVPGARAADP